VWTRTSLSQLLSWPAQRLRDEEGQTMAEYALILTLILIVTVAVIGLLSGQIVSLFNSVTGTI
jgi:Flp pilus assembly pilin Flp